MRFARRSGFVLPAALACVILIAVVATGALFASGQEASATRAAMLELQATGYAERSARLTIDNWDCAVCDSLPVGGVIMESHAAVQPLESTVYTTRLDSALFLVVAEGRVVASGATRVARRIAITVRTSRDSLGHARAVPLFPQSWTPIYTM